MVISTTPSIEGHKIARNCGIDAGEAIMGANLFKDLFAGIRWCLSVGLRFSSTRSAPAAVQPPRLI